jgi:glycosyltransferase involved in cell wall biosynthesis
LGEIGKNLVMKPLKIAQISPLVERVPPKKYGGTERVIHALTEELVRRGHQVTLYASGNSISSAKLFSVYPRSLREIKIKKLYGLNDLTLLNIGTAYKMQDQFDIIHDHNGVYSLAVANFSKTPVVMTIHGPFTTTNRHLYNTLNKVSLVAISKSQVVTAPKMANIVGVVYNGLKLDDYPFAEVSDDYLLYVGRISLEKGTHFAIEVAQELSLPLVIAAKLDESDMSYFNEFVGPSLSEDIKWVGEVTESERNKLMSKAKCLLHPVTWREPFGLTMIEAMACGCPVVAFNKGSIPEIVINNETGFVVFDIEEMIDAVMRIGQIDRKLCRNYALKNFNERVMTDNYEEIYSKILGIS